jgi:hypothetical protein
MGQNDQRNQQTIYRTFEEFEREELRRTDSVSSSVDELMTSLFNLGDDRQELDFEAPRKRRASFGDDDE